MYSPLTIDYINDIEVRVLSWQGRQFSRSLYVAEDIKAGEVITEQNVRSVRPGYGLHPKYLNEILGKKVIRDLEKGERMKLEDVEVE